MAASEDRVVLDRIEDWRRRLIDLSYRNRLIRYRPTRATTLEIESPSLDALLADLDRTAPWRFFFPPEPEEVSTDEVEDAADFVDSVVVTGTHRIDRAPRPDEVVVAERHPRQINRILENLARKSNAEFQDKALRILYIASGFLDWTDPSRNEKLSSPLILVPVELRRESAKHPYAMYFVDDEELVVNPSLTEKLRRDLGRDIPLDWAWEDKPVLEELAEIEAAVAGTGWSVRPDAVLGLFSFQKFVMYRDLLDNEEQISRHTIVRSLALKRLSDDVSGESIEIPPPSELDEVQPTHEDLLVLDSDATQRRAIEAAKRGQSFVMHGPPGTGKSQTIANVIAELIGTGKKVLFVSEKAAALDVVHRRLMSAGLDEYCLMLHGEHAARREVVDSLHRSLTSQLNPGLGMKANDLDRLSDLRVLLNSSADLAHLPIPTLGGRSMRDVLGGLAQLHAAPSVPNAPAASEQEGDAVRVEFQKLEDTFQRIAERWSVSSFEFAWRDYESDKFSSDQRGQVLTDVGRLRETTRRLASDADGCGRLLGWSVPINLRAADALIALGAHLELAPQVSEHWLDSPADELTAAASDAQTTTERLKTDEDTYRGMYPQRDVEGFDPNLAGLIDKSVRRLADTAGRTDHWNERLLSSLDELSRFLEAAPSILDELSAAALDAAARLGQPADTITLDRAEELADLATMAFTGRSRPEADWLVSAGLARVEGGLREFGPGLDDYQARELRLLESWNAQALEIEARDLLSRFSTEYTSGFAKLRGSYRRDAKVIKAVRKDGKMPREVENDLSELVDTQMLGLEIDRHASSMERAFGSYFRGRETQTADTEEALSVAREAIHLSAPNADLRALASSICVGSLPDPVMGQLADRIRANAASLKAGHELLRPFVGRPDILSTRDSLEIERERLLTLRERLGDLAEHVAHVGLNKSLRIGTLDDLCETSHLITEIHGLRAHVLAQRDHWQTSLAPYFEGETTDWGRLRDALELLRQLRELTGSAVPAALKTTLVSDTRRWPDFRGLIESREAYVASRDRLVERFEQGRAEELGLWTGQASFAEVEAWCDDLESHIDGLFDWVEFRVSRSRAVASGWGDFVGELVERSVPASGVVNAFRRAYWHSRLEALFDVDPDLADRGSTYARWIDEFRNLDRRLVATGADRVIQLRNKNRTAHVSVVGSEVALLRNEAAKKRRHRPVRKLLAAMPSLLSDLKPCLMMSPLTVSHFLAPGHEYDVVIFDEASQVPPQDAINCIYRGRQLIVAGDGRQLPPTPFFQVSELDDSWQDDGEETTEDMESVLDSSEALLPEHSLRWHYRSRHEQLIAFSNQHVYDGSLVTFPSADHHSEHKGVRFRFVPDGIYDRGKTSTNRVEARAVAERVVTHLKSGRHSVGVITFNLAQSNAVSEELDRLRIENPELERHFAGDRLDAVFVKHLESVQGDERDVVIFSIGYGRGSDGKFTMNFGPLNKDGGYRRLNVAVTRARELVEVVSSVRAADFTLSETASRGATLLREYLRYAETHGSLAEGTQPSDAEREYGSPVEEAIGEAVRELGYEAVPQVGAGSFRIDVAVRDPATPERFVLGVLTDSLYYSSIPTARDRDRLREEVLTKILGWRIHRIWALDWVRNRQAEVERLREAIERSSVDDEPVDPVVEEQPEIRERTEREVPELGKTAHVASLPWVETYKRVELDTEVTFYEFHESVNRSKQRDLVVALVEGEAPVQVDYVIQRLAQAWGLKRAGHRVRSAALQAIKMAIRNGIVEQRESFLWRPGQELVSVRAPDPSDPRTQRSIELIAPEEIDIALVRLIEASGSAGEHVFSDVARVLGFDRVGATIQKVLRERLSAIQAIAREHD